MRNVVVVYIILISMVSVRVAFGQNPAGNPSKTTEPNIQTNEPAAETEEQKPILLPPTLVQYVEAPYPEEALAKGLEAKVPTRISIDENGMVTDVKILEPQGHGFDEAAREAIFAFLFEPATKNGEPIPSQVDYKYTFFITITEEAESASLKGIIADTNQVPVFNAAVVLTLLEPAEVADPQTTVSENTDGVYSVLTDEAGQFKIEKMLPGSYQLDIEAATYKPYSNVEVFQKNESLTLRYTLELEKSTNETIVRGRKPPREVTRREITRREIVRIPGTGGDALRSIQAMPGVARPPGMGGQLIIRGSSPGDSSYYFDQTMIPMLYHFGGATSIINSDLLDRIDFYPGNYSVRYGNATGGIVDVFPKSPAKDRFHASIDADFWDASVLIETPLGENWSVAASGRRSYVDAILKNAMPDNGGFSFTVAPRYYDYQFVADYHPKSQKDHLRLFVFGSDDKMEFIMGNDVTDNPNFHGGLSFRIYFHQIQARWKHNFSKKLSNSLNLAVGYWLNDSSFGGMFKFELKQMPIFIMDELSLEVNDHLILRAGIDLDITYADWFVRAPQIIPMEGEPMDPLTTDMQITQTKDHGWFAAPAWYGEVELKPIEALRLIYGLRAFYYGPLKKISVDPRFVTRYQLTDKTVLKGGVGMFHQSPEPAEWDEHFGNPNIDLIKSIHYSLGVEQELTDYIQLNVEGFYKNLFDLVVSSGDETRFNNEGKGDVIGLEFMLKHNPSNRFFGWIAYTLMKSERVDHPGEPERLFDYDQTHILQLVASVILGRGWEAGVRFRLVSGNPETPITGAVYDADSDIYIPYYGPPNSVRAPMFHQLDLRIDKGWKFKHTKLGVYVDVQNIYNRKNVEGTMYSYDFSEKANFHGVPLFPSLGVKFEY